MAEGLNDTGTLAGSFYILISKLEGERLGLAWAFESLKYTTSDTCPILKSVPAARGQALKQMSLWGPFSLKPPSSLPTLSVETGCLVEYGAHDLVKLVGKQTSEIQIHSNSPETHLLCGY